MKSNKYTLLFLLLYLHLISSSFISYLNLNRISTPFNPAVVSAASKTHAW